MNKKDLNFDFIVVPMELLLDKKLQTLDCLVYGVIYGASQLKQKRCFLSNQGIAETVGSTPSTIANSLVRLEDVKAIHRVFEDAAKRHRTEIIPLVKYGKIPYKRVSSTDERDSSTDERLSSTDETTIHPQMKRVSSTDEQSNNIEKEEGVIRYSNSENFQKEIKKLNKKTKKVEGNLNDHISLFLKLFPLEFTGRSNAFSNLTTREAVGDLMQLYSYKQIKIFVDGYTERRTEKFAPSAGSIIEFCKHKFAKVEQFLNKNERGSSHLLADFGAKENFKSQKEQELSDQMVKNILNKRKAKK